jgi:hypothetical protein
MGNLFCGDLTRLTPPVVHRYEVKSVGCCLWSSIRFFLTLPLPTRLRWCKVLQDLMKFKVYL